MSPSPLALVRHLSKTLPANFAVKMVWKDICYDNSVATCALMEPKGKRPYFLIELSRKRLPDTLEWIFVWETVVHEYAHALAWTPAHRNLRDHGPLWGVAYSMVYEHAKKKFPLT